MATGIYKITNKINSKCYIGQSKNIEKRWSQHIKELNKNSHCNKHLQSAWNKYGQVNFNFEILCLCDYNNLNELETFYWNKYQPNVYNLHRTGNAHNISNELKHKLSIAHKGKKHSIEWNKHLSESRKGKYCKEKNGFYGKHHTKESLIKISNAAKGRKLSDEQKEKLRQKALLQWKNQSHKLTEQHKLNLKKAWERKKKYGASIQA